jgi:hypothetical protein
MKKVFTSRAGSERSAAKILLIFGGFFMFPNLIAVFGVLSSNSGESGGTVGLSIAAAVGFIPFVIGLYKLLRPKEMMLIDESAQIVLFRRRPEPEITIKFEEMSPIRIITEVRKVHTKNGSSNVTYYCINTKAIPDTYLFESTFELTARLKGEEFAKLFKAALKSPSGEIRQYEELDKPFYERFERDESVNKEPDAPFGTNLRFRDLMPGLEIRTVYHSKLPILIASVGVGIFWLVIIIAAVASGTVNQLFSGEAEQIAAPVIILFSVFSFIGIFLLYLGIRASYFQNPLKITPKELMVGREKIPLNLIEEINIDDNIIRIISDKDMISISTYFCPDNEKEYLLKKIRHAVVLTGLFRKPEYGNMK